MVVVRVHAIVDKPHSLCIDAHTRQCGCREFNMERVSEATAQLTSDSACRCGIVRALGIACTAPSFTCSPPAVHVSLRSCVSLGSLEGIPQCPRPEPFRTTRVPQPRHHAFAASHIDAFAASHIAMMHASALLAPPDAPPHPHLVSASRNPISVQRDPIWLKSLATPRHLSRSCPLLHPVSQPAHHTTYPTSTRIARARARARARSSDTDREGPLVVEELAGDLVGVLLGVERLVQQRAQLCVLPPPRPTPRH
eukprot:533447-Rhodomonas_salina.1